MWSLVFYSTFLFLKRKFKNDYKRSLLCSYLRNTYFLYCLKNKLVINEKFNEVIDALNKEQYKIFKLIQTKLKTDIQLRAIMNKYR